MDATTTLTNGSLRQLNVVSVPSEPVPPEQTEAVWLQKSVNKKTPWIFYQSDSLYFLPTLDSVTSIHQSSIGDDNYLAAARHPQFGVEPHLVNPFSGKIEILEDIVVGEKDSDPLSFVRIGNYLFFNGQGDFDGNHYVCDGRYCPQIDTLYLLQLDDYPQ